MKAFAEGVDHSNRWTKFGDFTVPQALDLGVVDSAIRAIELAYQLGLEGKTSTAFLSHFSDMVFFAFEGVGPPQLH